MPATDDLPTLGSEAHAARRLTVTLEMPSANRTKAEVPTKAEVRR